jgi:uncharacterized protein YeaO (DUF488 family)
MGVCCGYKRQKYLYFYRRKVVFMNPDIHIKRIYEPFSKEDGFRVLVDRVWPRGISKATIHLDLWAKEIAPGTALRKWFNHDPALWQAFQTGYKAELDENDAVEAFIRECSRHPVVTFLYGAKDTEHNQAIVLQQYITQKLKHQHS